MKCRACQHDNPDDNRFCEACGAPLTTACPSCGHENPLSARFCGGCGAALTSEPASQESGAEAADAVAVPTADRRPVAVLFADLSDFTRISHERDSEETHGILERFFETADGIIERYGGVIDKHIGDCAMAVFGAPIAHGDDPQRAVRAAADIHAAMPDLGAELAIRLRVHIGVASGEVIATGTGSSRHEEYTVTGDSVNLAARLQDMAAAGETLISDAVHRSTSTILDCEPLDEVEVKGFAEPVRVWRVLSLRERGAEGSQSSFVGRRSELAQFNGILRECKASGTGCAIYVRGEAGIGKTRLVSEFVAAAIEQGFRCHRGLVFDFGVERGQDAIRTVVHSLFGLSPHAGVDERSAAADRGLAEGWVTRNDQVFLNDLFGLPQPAELRPVYEAMENATRNRGKQSVVSQLVAGASRKMPALVIIEDLHWADPTTLAYLAALASTVEDCPALLIMTSRVHGDPLDGIWRGASHLSALVTFDLGPLRQNEARALAKQRIGLAQAGSQLAESCIERAEGNPLFLEQLLRGAERGSFTEVPASIQGIILSHVDQLAPEDKHGLLAASVIGQRFGLASLRHLMGDSRYRPNGLLAHRLIRAQGDEEYLFAHALIQESVYQSILKMQRRELHKRAAGWFAQRDADVHAQHLDRAEDPTAPRAYLEAARSRVANLQYESARALVERGLVLATAREDTYALLCLRGELLHDLGPVEASIESYRRSLSVAESDIERCRALLGLAEGMRVTDNFDEGFKVLDEAEATAGRDMPYELARIHYLRGNLYFPLGRNEECKEQQMLSLHYAKQAGSPEAEARALGGLGDAEFILGRIRTSNEHFRHCLALCREHGLKRTEVANRSMLGFTWLFLNDTGQALAECFAAIDAAVQVGHARAELAGLNVACNVLHDMADFPRLREQVERAQALVRRLGAWRFEAQNLMFLALVLNAEGRTAESIETAREAWKVSQATSVGFSGPRILGTLALLTRDPAERKDALAKGEQLLGTETIVYNHFCFCRDAIDVSLDDHDWDAADRYAAALKRYAESEPLPWTELVISRAKALAAFGRGLRDDRTIAALKSARDEARRAGLNIAVPALDAALGHA
jgi:class 3 adenylate cyclase/tetratricopeptide (TPR) repeat protein